MEEKVERDSQGTGLRDERKGAPFSSLATFLSPFPRPTWFLFYLGFYVGLCCGSSRLQVRDYDSILAPSVSTHPLKLGFGYQH